MKSQPNEMNYTDEEAIPQCIASPRTESISANQQSASNLDGPYGDPNT
jgi:hypothetical protein